MKGLRRLFAPFGAALLLASGGGCGSGQHGLPPLGDPCDAAFGLGVSAPYAGVAEGALLVAGGANFPDVPAADGGRKGFYEGIYLLRDGAWRRAGSLPRAAAYGATCAVEGALYCVGGSGPEGAFADVWRLVRRGDSVAVREAPALPRPVEQAAGAAIGRRIYLAGGLAAGLPSSALWVLDTSEAAPQWREAAPLPEALVQPVMAASGGCLYLWGGFDPATGEVSGRGYRYDPAADRWSAAAGHPTGGTFTGACAATLADGRIAVAGGVDRTLFAEALRLPPERMRDYLSQPAEAYRFQRTPCLFDPSSGRWSLLAESPHAARAGAALVVADGGLCLVGGELKPGIRTPDVRVLPLTEP